jgi:hypothetical protein
MTTICGQSAQSRNGFFGDIFALTLAGAFAESSAEAWPGHCNKQVLVTSRIIILYVLEFFIALSFAHLDWSNKNSSRKLRSLLVL